MVQVRERQEAQKLRQLNIPVINYSNGTGAWDGIGNVLSNDRAVGQMAARNMLKRGYKRFLGIGQAGRQFSKERLEGFEKEILKAGGEINLIEVTGAVNEGVWSPGRYLEEMWEELGPPIRNLPLEAGLFAASDWLAWPVIRLLENKIPGRLYTSCLIGVDNMHDAMFDPRKTAGLSSVVPGFRQIGRESLAILMSHIEGKQSVETVMRRCPPERIAERASSAGPACADPLTAKILRQMWNRLRAGQEVEIADMARAEGMTARTLERKFSRYLGKSAREWRAAMRIDYAQEMLCERNLHIGEIALRCGYADAPAFSSAFKKATGQSPRAWREEN